MQNKGIQPSRLLKLVVLALMGTISFVLFFLNFPVPLLPTPYLKIDFSEVPALIAALIFSPVAGVIVEAVKNLLYLAVSGSGDPIGVTANFVAGVMFIYPVALLYHKFKGLKGLVFGLITGTVIMTIGMSVLNFYVILPVYAWFLGLPEMAETSAKTFAVFAGVLPFNMIKGIVVGLLFIPLFVKMKVWIEQQQSKFAAD
ncbi:ECF transporter S component [Virgibacillus kekensis]|uniref:Riboflavin transporter n=1 Tax=Virgibacillus kekensis TaxID=202261 RepID=A0ABV9DIQ2_9BACI